MVPESDVRILVAEDDASAAQRLRVWLEQAGLACVGVARDGSECLRMAAELLPDALLLDMVMPRLDGLAVLERLPGLSLVRMPAVVALVPSGLTGYDERAQALGACSVLLKPVEREALIEALAALRPEQRLRGRALHPEQVGRALRELGIPLHLKGYRYLLSAVELAGSDSSLLKQLTTQLYPMVARQHDTTAVLVERSIRHAIEVAWSGGQLENQYRFFGNTIDARRGKPTSGEFIARVVDALRLEEIK